MKRNWAVRPDQTGTVSREALIEALIDGATMLDLAGGVLEVVVGRAPTDVPGEMVLTGAILTWKDKTDATTSPEPARAVVPEQRASDSAASNEQPKSEQAEMIAIMNTPTSLPASDDNPDGFPLDTLVEEDIDEPVPASAR